MRERGVLHRERVRWFLILLVGCVTPYHQGAIVGDVQPIGGCLDLAVLGGLRSEAVGAVVVYRFGNRCDHKTLLDLASVRVRSAQGELVAYDPAHEIVPLDLTAFGSGEEWIEYSPGGNYDWLDVDIGRVAGDIGTTWVHVRMPR